MSDSSALINVDVVPQNQPGNLITEKKESFSVKLQDIFLARYSGIVQMYRVSYISINKSRWDTA